MVTLPNYKRGEIYFADLSPVIGSEQGGVRPVLIVQNDVGNHFSPTVIIAAITAKMAKAKLPTHIGIKASKTGVGRDSVILLEQIRTIDKSRLKEKVGALDEYKMREVDRAIAVSVGLMTNPAQKEKKPKMCDDVHRTRETSKPIRRMNNWNWRDES